MKMTFEIDVHSEATHVTPENTVDAFTLAVIGACQSLAESHKTSLIIRRSLVMGEEFPQIFLYKA